MIRVLYNACYGGYSLSAEACDEIKKLRSKPPIYTTSIGDRCDPVVLAVYDKLGAARFSGRHAKIQVETVDAKYINYISIHEYDGLESVEINQTRYKKHAILNDPDMSDSEKVRQLKIQEGLI
jgi:hypothetical protein